MDSSEFARHWNRGWRGGMGVLGFKADSRERVDEIYADLTAARYRGQQPPYDAFFGARYAVVEDPDGNAIGIMSPADPDRRSQAHSSGKSRSRSVGCATPCTEWDVRSLVGHLITGRHVYRGFLEGVPVAELRLMLRRQGEAAGDDPAAACESAVRSIRAAFAQPGALERSVHHTIGDMPGRQLLVQLVGNVWLYRNDRQVKAVSYHETEADIVSYTVTIREPGLQSPTE